MDGWFGVVQEVGPRDDLRHFNELIASWPVQVACLLLYVAVACLAYSRVVRDFDDGPGRRRVRAVVIALGVLVGLELVLGSSMAGIAILPFWVQFVVLLWLAGMFLYYLVRFLTATRSGSGDDETRRRGAALDGVLAPPHDERGKPSHPAPPG